MGRSGTIGAATDARLQIAANDGGDPAGRLRGGATRSEMLVVIVSVDTKKRRAQQASAFLRTPDCRECAARSFLPLNRSDSFLDTGQLPALPICQPASTRQPPLRSRYKLPCAVLFPPVPCFDFFGTSMRYRRWSGSTDTPARIRLDPRRHSASPPPSFPPDSRCFARVRDHLIRLTLLAAQPVRTQRALLHLVPSSLAPAGLAPPSSLLSS